MQANLVSKSRASSPGPIVALIAAWFLLAQSVSAQSDRPADFYRVDVGFSSLNIRDEPSTSAGVLVRLKTGTVLRNLGCRVFEEREWCAVEQPVRGGVRGWAASDFLRATSPPASATDVGRNLLAGARLSATGQIACAIAPEAPLAACEFGIVRGGTGNAVVVVQLPNGAKRTIRFDQGVPTSSDAGLIVIRRSGDATRIAIGAAERYEVPDSVVGRSAERN